MNSIRIQVHPDSDHRRVRNIVFREVIDEMNQNSKESRQRYENLDIVDDGYVDEVEFDYDIDLY